MNTKNTSGILVVCALVVPTAFVFGTRYIGAGATSASASLSEPLSTEFNFPNYAPAEQTHEWDESRPVQSPFYYEPMMEVVDLPQPIDQGRPRPTDTGNNSLPPVSVTSILPNPRTPLAIIDGRPRRVGDMLESGWKVISINGDDFTVTLIHTTGKKINAKLNNEP